MAIRQWPLTPVSAQRIYGVILFIKELIPPELPNFTGLIRSLMFIYSIIYLGPVDTINMYSGTCLNRPVVGPATYGLFIQVVSLCKFEILKSVFNRSIRLHVLLGDWCKTDQRVLKESVPIRRWKWSVIENGDTLIAIFVRNNSHDLWCGVIIPLLISSEWSLVYINRIKMGFGTENHGLNLRFTSGLFRQVEWPIHCML